MVLKKIALRNFRNFIDSSFEFGSELTVIVGENAKGKTNLLEAIFFLINGIGFRETKEIELLNFASRGHAEVAGAFLEDGEIHDFKIVLAQRGESVEKGYLVDKMRRRHYQYAKEQTKAVLFTPQQIEMLTGSPEKRREYFNRLISFYDLEYKRRLDNYEQALRKRNRILEHHENLTKLQAELSFWNDYLEEEASYVTKRRIEYADFLNKHPRIDAKTFQIEYQKNEFTRKKAQEIFAFETRIRRTAIGPQKDDVQIYLDGKTKKNISRFGSRSEQRLTILWLKMNEIAYHREIMKKDPILLFDDVFSELDEKNRKIIFGLIKNHQTVATTTDKKILDLAKTPKKVIPL